MSWITRLLFSPHCTQRVKIAISLCKQFAQLLAVLLANLRVPDSLTMEINKTGKVSETGILPFFTKVTNHAALGQMEMHTLA